MILSAASVPRLAPGVRLHFDGVRQAWTVLAPERLFLPDAQALTILRLVDGANSLTEIVDALAAQYLAARETISADVMEMLQDLAAKGAIRL